MRDQEAKKQTTFVSNETNDSSDTHLIETFFQSVPVHRHPQQNPHWYWPTRFLDYQEDQLQNKNNNT